MKKLDIVHTLNRQLPANIVDDLIQNLGNHAKSDLDESLYILLDQTANTHILSAVQTIQQYFPQLIFSKINKQADLSEVAKDLGATNILTITNANILTTPQITFAQKQLAQEIGSDKTYAYNHKDIAIRSEKSLWQKFLLYWKYES